MSQIEITESEYEVADDIYGCGKITKRIIKKVGEGSGQGIRICDECLQGIINAAPLEMILNRPELQTVDEDQEESENVGKAQEGENYNPMTFDEMSFTELKDIAIEKGLKFKVGMSKLDLIAYLEGDK
jgi:hypothetical protein